MRADFTKTCFSGQFTTPLKYGMAVMWLMMILPCGFVSLAALPTEQSDWLVKFSVCFGSDFRYSALLDTTTIKIIVYCL
jgi:hypothetical protein